MANLPPEGTALWRAQRRRYNPDHKGPTVKPPPEWWTPTLDLLALIADRQALQMWQAGGAKGPRPLPIERPGHEEGRRTYGGEPMTPEEFHAQWASHAAVGVPDEGAYQGDVEEGPAGADDDPDDGEGGAAQVVALGGDEAGDAQGQAEDAEAEE